MGDLGGEQLELCRPFQHVSLDIMGPFVVRGMGGQARKTFKAWATVWVCSATRAVSVWTIASYSTDDFMVGLSNHFSIYGRPTLVVTDRGTQIMAAADQSPNWDTVQHKTASQGIA